LTIAPALGANRKASLLHYLVGQARHEILVVNDSDMRATPDYLRRVVAPLADPQVGLVTCPYRGELPLTPTARLEALHMGAIFLPSVIVARHVLAMRFAMGATIALRRKDLTCLGGFAAVADYLADDFQVGRRISALGLKVYLSDYVIASVLGATTFLEHWQREVRWARTNRVCRPREYPVMLLTFSTPLALVLALFTGFTPPYTTALVISLVLRWLVAWSVSGCTADHVVRRWLLWLPVRDILSAVVWLVGGLGDYIVWRGERFRLLPGGQMEPAPEAPRWIRQRHAW
jgi:ceramide glucosyltransferase